MRRGRLLPHGYTLLEVLIVIAIVVLVSSLTLPTLVSGLSHRQVSESARILQAALAGGATRRFVTTHRAAFDVCLIPCLTGSTAQRVCSTRLRPLQPIESSPSIRRLRIATGGQASTPFHKGFSCPIPGTVAATIP